MWTGNGTSPPTKDNPIKHVLLSDHHGAVQVFPFFLEDGVRSVEIDIGFESFFAQGHHQLIPPVEAQRIADQLGLATDTLGQRMVALCKLAFDVGPARACVDVLAAVVRAVGVTALPARPDTGLADEAIAAIMARATGYGAQR